MLKVDIFSHNLAVLLEKRRDEVGKAQVHCVTTLFGL